MPVQQIDRGADQLGAAHALEGVVGAVRQDLLDPLGRGEEVRGAELPGHRLLAGVGVDRDDRQRAGDARALDHVEPDAAGADHDDALAAVDLGPVQYGSDPGQHPAADQGGRGQGQVGGDLHRLHGLDQGPFGEGRVGRELVERLPTARERLPRHPDRLAAHRGPAPVALRARAAAGQRGQGHVVARRDVVHARADRLHHARALVPEHHGRREGDRPVDHRQIAVAEPCRGHRHQHLAGAGVAYLQVVDDLGPRAVENDASHLGSLGRPSARCARRWCSVGPGPCRTHSPFQGRGPHPGHPPM